METEEQFRKQKNQTNLQSKPWNAIFSDESLIPRSISMRRMIQVESLSKKCSQKHLKETKMVIEQEGESQSKQKDIFQASIDEDFSSVGLIELVNEANSRLLLPETEEDIRTFEKLFRKWSELTDKMRSLAQAASEFEKLSQNLHGDGPITVYGLDDLEIELVKTLEHINEGLSQLDFKLNELCDHCRCFPLSGGDSLFLTYKNSLKKKGNRVRAVYIHGNQPYLLNSTLFPSELLTISSPQHFTALLKDAHIMMHRDEKDLSKSTFTIQQNCFGGVNVEVIQLALRNSDWLLTRIRPVVRLSARGMQMMGFQVSEQKLEPYIVLGGIAGVGALTLTYGGRIRDVIDGIEMIEPYIPRAWDLLRHMGNLLGYI